MTQKQREIIKELKEKIKFLKRKYKTEELPTKQKRRDGRNTLKRYCCMICNKRYEWSFVCSNCVSKDLLKFQEKLDLLEKQVLSNQSPPVRTSNSTSLTSDKPKGFNMGLEVSATPTPKSPTATSPNPNIKLNKSQGA